MADESKRKKNAFNLPDEVLEKVRDIAYWDRIPVNAIVREGIEMAIKKYEKKRGAGYPTREGELVSGRPVGRKSA